MDRSQSNGPKVSIITVCLNSEKTIEETIQSVLGQTYKNVEYLIIDGKSTDGTVDIIKQYSDRIAKWMSRPDDGLYSAMNQGISMSTGEIVGIINSDDRYTPDAIEKVVRSFCESDADLVYGDEMLVFEDGDTKKRESGDLASLAYKMCISHPATFVKKDMYIAFGMFDERYRIAADYELILRLRSNGAVMKKCPDVLAYFRIGGLSYTHTIECAEETKQISLMYLSKEDEEKYLPYIEQEYSYRMRRARIKKTKEDILSGTVSGNIVYKKRPKKNMVYIFGAGIRGRECLALLYALGISVEGFIDNDVKKEGTRLKGKKIFLLSDINDGESFIVIAAQGVYEDEIRGQLLKSGYCEWDDFCSYLDLIEKLDRLGVAE